MAQKIHTILFITDEDNPVTQDFVKVSLQSSELYVPILSFEGDADGIKAQMDETLCSLLLAAKQ